MRKSASVPPLARNVGREVLDWDHVEPEAAAHAQPRDVLGLSLDDRLALGMRPALTADTVPTLQDDATLALAEALAKGAAYGKRDKK